VAVGFTTIDRAEGFDHPFRVLAWVCYLYRELRGGVNHSDSQCL